MSIKNRVDDILDSLLLTEKIEEDTKGVRREAEANLFKRKVDIIGIDKIKILVEVLKNHTTLLLLNDETLNEYLEYMNVDNNCGVGQIQYNTAYSQYYYKNFDFFIDKTIEFIKERYPEVLKDIKEKEIGKGCNLKKIKRIFDTVQLFMEEKEKNNDLTVEEFLNI